MRIDKLRGMRQSVLACLYGQQEVVEGLELLEKSANHVTNYAIPLRPASITEPWRVYDIKTAALLRDGVDNLG